MEKSTPPPMPVPMGLSGLKKQKEEKLNPFIRYTYELVPFTQPPHPDIYFLSDHVKDEFHKIIEMCDWANIELDFFPSPEPVGYLKINRITGSDSQMIQQIFFTIKKNGKHV